MKRIVSVCSSLLVFVLLSAAVMDTVAQTVRIEVEAMSPGRRSSGPPNYTTPPGPNYVSTGLRVVGKGMMVYLSADTTGTVTSFNWTILAKPAGSTAAIDTPSNKFVRFIADLAGQYVIQVTADGSLTALDTIFASTYSGVATTPPSCGGNIACHQDKKTEWQATLHGSIFTRGITGQLEVGMNGRGAYSNNCVKCHTTGWEPLTDNGNFGYLAHQANWDSTWFIGLLYEGGDYWIPYQDSTIWNAMSTPMKQVANIGCESCHGPGANHFGDATKTDKSLNAGVCLQCHDAPKKHRLGSYWMASKHAIFEDGDHTARANCFPCHSGAAFVKWLDNKTNPGYNETTDGNVNIACSVCHDPHSDANAMQLRAVSVDSLKNGYVLPAGVGGKGQLCMNCHQSRYVQKVTNVPPYYGFGSRFSPHESPQTDMFLGRNSYEFEDPTLTGRASHLGVRDGCVTCHMSERVNGSSMHADHELAMVDTLGGQHDLIGACVECHGPITHFNDILASYDYDRNGVIEGLQTEVQGLLDILKSRLPVDATGEPIGGGTVTAADSAAIANRPDFVQGIWTYYFVRNDKSLGVHNPKYAVALLQKALGWHPTDVQPSDGEIPSEFALHQNYPNPFNPSTTISFALPRNTHVRLDIYNMVGQLVNTVVDKDMNAGNYTVAWEGLDNAGMKVASGVYLYRIHTTSFTAVKKMLLVK